MSRKVLIIFILFAVLAFLGAWYFQAQKNGQITGQKNIGPKLVADVDYLCNENKSMHVSYFQGEPKTVQPGEMPVPNGSVKLSLSDGREMELPQTISASGIRYANSDESFIFWGKGNGALVLENNQQTFIGCIVLAKDPGGLPQVYESGANGFSIRYPAGYSLDTSYEYQELGPGKEIWGVKFTIPKQMSAGKNLSSYDTGVSVEIIPNTQECSANLFIFREAEAQKITDNGAEYSFATTSGAGAGNFYEEMVWAIPGTNPCIAVRYLIHSTNIANYTPGTVWEFDRSALISEFDKIRRSLMIEQ